MTQEEMEARIEELEKENSELKQMLEIISDNIDNVRKCIHEHERYTVELIHELDDKVYFINRDL